MYARLQRREVSKLTVESGLIKYSIDGALSFSLFELCKWGVTTGQFDHKIAIQLNFDELCAILAIVS